MVDFPAPKKGVMSRYGKRMVRKDYYGVVNIMDLSDALEVGAYRAFVYVSENISRYSPVTREAAIDAMLRARNVNFADVFSSMRVKRG